MTLHATSRRDESTSTPRPSPFSAWPEGKRTRGDRKTMQWLDDVFGVQKPVIAMLHLDALPGDPSYDTAAGMRAVVDNARRDLDALQSGGVDAVMFSNEFSLP